MLDIKYIRENPEEVKENIKKKFQDNKLELVDKVIGLDSKKRELMKEVQDLRHSKNSINSKINESKKKGEKIEELLQQVKEIPLKIKELEEKLTFLDTEILKIVYKIPNIMHKDVPIGKDDSENVELKRIGEPKKFDFDIKSHVEICEKLGIADFESSARVAGNGYYYIQGDLALLNQALIRFGIDTMISKGFLYVETPLLLREEIIDQVTDLNDKLEQIYLLEGDGTALIGTSEHSLIGRYAGTTVNSKDLPVLQTSYSMCFRKEIGSHGIDEKGLFRTHQFNKIEMIVICEPEDSMKYYQQMQDITVEIFEKMGIPVRVLGICSGDLGDLKHIQIDVEAWSPRKNDYFEVGSCSNLTESQARKLKIKAFNGQEKYVPHTLNNTAIATSRALVAILENNQNEDGTITIPEVLRPFMNGKTIIKPN